MLMEDDGSDLTWTYQTFTLAGANDKYKLTIEEGEGPGHDAMKAVHNGDQFSTYDSDNDEAPSNCAYAYQGGWWYSACAHANLNAPHKVPLKILEFIEMSVVLK